MLPPVSIAVIGAGPSGLFFCNAIEQIMKKQGGSMEASSTNHRAGREVSVTCFERSSRAGGVWRAADPNTGDTTDMYDQLWTNGDSFSTEFFDYSYEEHFEGQPVSVYMQRADLESYILGRVTKDCPNFMEKYVEFQKDVVHVVYDEGMGQFKVTVKDLNASQTEVRHFDKCIWACGENSKRNIPETLVRMIRDGGFAGRLIHSSETANLQDDVRGKRVLLVGGGYSAEDLALQAIKLGVEKVYVSSRCISNEICFTNSWPMDKVEVLKLQEPCKVTENGRCIQFVNVQWTPRGYEKYGIQSEVRNIDTIILCTGYEANLDMMDTSLRKGYPTESHRPDYTFKAPQGWKMTKTAMSEITGDVEPSDSLRYIPYAVHPELYHGVLLSNPNMMFISAYGSYVPLLACDAHAWLLAGYASGWTELPSESEMRDCNERNNLALMELPYYREMMDEDYFEALRALKNFWPKDLLSYPKIWEDMQYEGELMGFKFLADVMQKGKYPFSLGTREKLNENAQALLWYGEMSYYHRNKLDPNDDEKAWKTFRDYENGDQFRSLHTGAQAVSLKQRWMEMNGMSMTSSENAPFVRK